MRHSKKILLKDTRMLSLSLKAQWLTKSLMIVRSMSIWKKLPNLPKNLLTNWSRNPNQTRFKELECLPSCKTGTLMMLSSWGMRIMSKRLLRSTRTSLALRKSTWVLLLWRIKRKRRLPQMLRNGQKELNTTKLWEVSLNRKLTHLKTHILISVHTARETMLLALTNTITRMKTNGKLRQASVFQVGRPRQTKLLSNWKLTLLQKPREKLHWKKHLRVLHQHHHQVLHNWPKSIGLIKSIRVIKSTIIIAIERTVSRPILQKTLTHTLSLGFKEITPGLTNNMIIPMRINGRNILRKLSQDGKQKLIKL